MSDKTYVATFNTSVQISEDSWKVVHPTMQVFPHTTVAEINEFFQKAVKNHNKSVETMEITLIECTS